MRNPNEENYSPPPSLLFHRHCQSFKAKYIALAKEINHRLPDDESEINFHAVSCSVYHWVCMQNNVKGFPTFVLFHADSAEPHWLKEEEMTVERIAETFGVQLQAPPEMGNGLDSNREGIDEIAPIDILGASVNGLARTRETLYKDAALSFVHALKTGIFLHEDGGETRDSLNSVQREVFSDWIDLLSWSLPPSWILHTLINEIRNNIDYVMDSEENLMLTVSKHEALVLGGNMKWSTQCSEHAGYSCGLWGLLHIISMGVIERHRAVLGARDQVSTQFVARTTRNYIEHFFDCKQCKEYFLSMYDTCGFNHCRRFKQSQKVPSKEPWSEFSLWLWEVHNDVNIKLAKVASKGEDSGDRRNRNADVFSWPSQGECPACRGITGKWDKDAVLSHLKRAYWYVPILSVFDRDPFPRSPHLSKPRYRSTRPGGVQNFRYVVLKKKDKKRENERSRFMLDKFVYLLLAGIIFMWCTRKRNVASSGRHKKTDHDYL